MSNNIYDDVGKILDKFYDMTDAILAKLTTPVADVDLSSNAKTLNGETVTALVKAANDNVRDHIALKNNPHGLNAHGLGGVTKSEADALNNTMSMNWFPVSLFAGTTNVAGSGEDSELTSESPLASINQFTFKMKRPWRVCMAGLVMGFETVNIDFSKCPHFQKGRLKVYFISDGKNIYVDVFPDYQPETMTSMYVGEVTITDTTISSIQMTAVSRLGRHRFQESMLGASVVMETGSMKINDWRTK